jgi:hypothetical protein
MLQQEGDGATGVVDSITRGRRRRRAVAATDVWCCYHPSAAVLPATPVVAASGGRRCYHRPPALLQVAAGRAIFRERWPAELLSVSGGASSDARRSCNRWPAVLQAAAGGATFRQRRPAELLSVNGGAAGPSGVAASGVWYCPSRVLLPPAPSVAASSVRRCYPSISGSATDGAAIKFSRSCKRLSSMLLLAVVRAASGSPRCCKGFSDGWRLRRRDRF